MTDQWAHMRTPGYEVEQQCQSQGKEVMGGEWRKSVERSLGVKCNCVSMCVFWRESVNTWTGARTTAEKSNLVPFLFQQ